MLSRPIPSTGELLPVIGLGTWQTFDVGASERERAPLIAVLERFAAGGGTVIDSSPMYGRAEEVVGALRDHVPQAFVATKVWTRGREQGIAQMRRSMSLLRAGRLDLMQIHNLIDWRVHLDTLRRWKDEGLVRYIGITHYTRGAFAEVESILRSEPVDFVQLPLSIGAPEAEERLLPLAEERGIAVLVNRPFEEGALLRGAARRPLPEWASAFGARSWGELFLRWIVAHPAVTCVIPATRNPAHMEENLRAGDEPVWTPEQRREVARALWDY